MPLIKKNFLCLLTLLLLLPACAALADTSFRFAAFGDTRGNDPTTNTVNDVVLAEIRDQLLTENIDLVLVDGDLTYMGTQPELEHWASLFMDPLLQAGIRVYPTRGNHDGFLSAWNTVFSGNRALPANGPNAASEVTYSVAHKTALFVALDRLQSTLAVNQAWLDPVFAANTLPHVFVMNHYPAYAVVHTDCLAENPTLRDAFWDSMGAAGCRVYFCGHDHLYNRARVQDSAGNWICQYLVGSGGAPLYIWTGTYADPSVQGIFSVGDYGYCVVDVQGAQVTLAFKQRSPSLSTPYVTVDTYTYLSPLAKVTAGFKADKTIGDPPMTVYFTDTTSSNVEDGVEWQWDFGDGSISTDQNPSHTYLGVGDYTVSLTVTTAHMKGSKTQASYVHAGTIRMPAVGVVALIGLFLALLLVSTRILKRQAGMPAPHSLP